MIRGRKPLPRLLLTGATGFIGGALASRLLTCGQPLVALVRTRDAAHAVERLRQRFLRGGQKEDSDIPVLCGDVTEKNWGLDRNSLRRLADRCEVVLHAAGETSFKETAPCWETNVGAVQNLVEMVRSWSPSPRIFFVSSASVCLRAETSVITEDAPYDGYVNGYVLSKRGAEKILLNSGLDVVILRPTIVVDREGHDRRFARSILWVIPAIQRLGMVPINPGSGLDIVSLDYVAECIMLLMKRSLRHAIYHISAGAPGASRVAEIVDSVYLGGLTGGLRFVSLEEWQRRKRSDRACARLMEGVEYYLPFISSSAVYSNERISQELGDELPELVPFPCYCRQMLDLIAPQEAILESERP